MTAAVIAHPVTTSMTTPQKATPKAVGKARVAFESRPTVEGFAFARVNGKVHLVLLTSSPCCTMTVRIFRHEFISIFRLADILTIHCNDLDEELRVLESIDEDYCRYEEDSETVFLAKDLTQRLAKMADPMSPGRPGAPGLFGPTYPRRRTRF